jgi:SAM-dependent methyltransferase
MPTDPKLGEREYFARIGAEGIRHSLRKPFSEAECTKHLSNIDAIFHLIAPPPARIIEFGCGVGWLATFLAQRGYEVWGVDISPDAIAAAREALSARGLANLHFAVGDYEEPPPRCDFDYAIFYGALHHAEDEYRAVQQAYAALHPGGVMIAFETDTGHAGLPASVRAVEEFGVHEKDMSCTYIAELGHRAGFTRHLILQRPHQILRSLYRPSYALSSSGLDLKLRLFLSKLRVIRHLFHRYEDKFIVLWK